MEGGHETTATQIYRTFLGELLLIQLVGNLVDVGASVINILKGTKRT